MRIPDNLLETTARLESSIRASVVCTSSTLSMVSMAKTMAGNGTMESMLEKESVEARLVQRLSIIF
jgi:chlorite dismutase